MLPVKNPKAERRCEDRTVFILSCDGKYALQKRPPKGLLAGLWQFPNVPGKLELSDAVSCVENSGVKLKEIKRQVEKKHIFTHIEWRMSGFYMETKSVGGEYVWMTSDEINAQAALPTAFRQFWEEIESV